jgi:hypothetical protein
MSEDTTFDVPVRPERRYPPSGGVEYEGDVVFLLTPEADSTTAELDEVLGEVLAGERYVRGDFFDLPAPAYLVRDEAVDTSFRVVVREGTVQLHVLPHTDVRALEALYDRLVAAADLSWTVETRVERPSGSG